ncbi:uncharacterized protein LY89DRAFT_684121 [Mollisia scopiformis]|uniref:GPI anchored protein n=1 Tax=Mollisia scopiformis TaxID=149040 RepID=A0A194XDD2_MOLSC|nr:uncharacterized protein LY89DRAFT_684121 [Mollisia scopiformis]KUJ18183.1 hypothetical protein LY89DRAFT_684121 [Mollisia scopiformis]
MRINLSILALPASILTLIALHTTSVLSTEDDQSPKQWPYNLPPHVKYWPEDPPNRRRDLEAIEEHLRLGRAPVGIMKMGTDEGEKFYMEYWQFEGEMTLMDISSNTLRKRDEEEEARLLANASAVLDFRPPFMLHTEDSSYGNLRARRALEARNALAVLGKRGFLCPTGTADCSSIGQPNYCCATGETCFAIQDAGLGPVGCCPTGSTCGGTVTTCNAPNTPCADNVGGGCCIPNYVCATVGCVINPSMVITTVITQTVTLTASSSTQTSTIVITTTSTTSSSSSSTSSTCTSSYQSCPASLGGGCCPTDRLCASGASCAPLSTTTTTTVSTSTTGTSTVSGVAPVRPTSDSSTSTQSSITGTTCPTGFYACEAYYAGGCCRTGRDCQTTSCPPVSSTTIISGTVTVVVPVGSAATVNTPTGACATGWSTCSANVGGNCCPSGWQCGTASCSSVGATSTAVLQKESPSLGLRDRGVDAFFAAFAAFVVGLMLL